MSNRLFIAAYDVVEPRRLIKARRAATGFAHGGQKSVLECWLPVRQRGGVFREIRAAISPRYDKLGLFFIGRGERALVLGRATQPSDPPAFVIG